MKEVVLKKGKHLILIQVNSIQTTGKLEAIVDELKGKLSEDFTFIMSQPSTEISILTLED